MRYIINKYLKNLNRIEFVITNSCTGKCKHCSQDSHISNVPIHTHPAWLVSKSDDNAYNAKTKEILKKFNSLGIEQSDGNIIFPSGNTLKYLGSYFNDNAEQINPYIENPRDMKTISFSANGDVLNENIYNNSILEIIEHYEV